MIGDTYEVTSICRSWQGQNMLNVLHFRVESFSGTEATALQIATDLDVELANIWRPFMGAYAGAVDRYEGVKVRRVLPTITAPVFSVAAAGNGLIVGGGHLPVQISFPWTLRAATAPANVRGRLFSPRMTTNDITTDGRPGAGIVVGLQAFLDALLTTNNAVATGGGMFTQIRGVIYSRVHASVYPITQCVGEQDWGQQRRRSGLNRSDRSAI